MAKLSNKEILGTLVAATLFFAGCAKQPAISLDDDNDGGGGNTEGNLVCDHSAPLSETFNINPSSIRGANIVLVIDDSGSMGEEISKVVNNIDSFITDLSQNTQDKLRLLLLFNTRGFVINKNNPMGGCQSDGLTVDETSVSCGNGTPFSTPYTNPFAAKIDNQKVFYVNEGVGSRSADVALFRAFSQSSFSQVLPSTPLVDGGNIPQGGCMGPGAYWRPRACTGVDGITTVACGSESSLGQTATTCYFSPARTSVSNGVISGPLSHLMPGIAINVAVFSDDDLNVAGGFTGANVGGRTLVHNMMKQVFAPLGSSVPLYYHSVVGLQTAAPPGTTDTLARVGVNHQGLSILTDGLKADVRLNDYGAVLDALKTKIIFSEQVIESSCAVTNNAPLVFKDGELLDVSLYQYQEGSKEIRILPSAFTEDDLNRSVEFKVIY